MIIVTGGAGFIGSNLVYALNQQRRNDILVVDDLTDGHKFTNLVDCDYYDYIDKDDFIDSIYADEDFAESIDAVFHQGACSATTEWNGKYMMDNNYQYSKVLLHYCLERSIPFIYASSAATYGNQQTFIEQVENEKPINVYGYSKFLFDQYVRRLLPNADSQVVGTRYFNVYGPRESHKGSMASVAYHHYQQLQTGNSVKLFQGCDGYADGEQVRDFIYVEDAVAVNLWFLQNPHVSGIFNLGTGRAQPFNDVGNSVIKAVGKGHIDYIPFPEKLKGHYQSYTKANLSKLRQAGCGHRFKTVQEGVSAYIHWLQSQ